MIQTEGERLSRQAFEAIASRRRRSTSIRVAMLVRLAVMVRLTEYDRNQPLQRQSKRYARGGSIHLFRAG
jgi:hypothetical protein